MFEQVKQMLAKQFDLDPETITPATSLIDDIGADSLDVVELVMELEETYGITVPDDDLAKLTTVGGIVEYIEAHR